MTSFASGQRPVHAWTRWYWPVALIVAVLAFFVPYLAGWGLAATGIGLAAGSLALGVPELASLATGNDQDTLSDWVWRGLRVTPGQPVNRWDARRFLPVGVYLLIAGSVEDYLFNLAHAYWQFWLLFSAGIFFFGIWLFLHFFEHWWA